MVFPLRGPDGHSHAVVVSLLIVTQRLKIFGSKKLECGSSVRSMPGIAPL